MDIYFRTGSVNSFKRMGLIVTLSWTSSASVVKTLAAQKEPSRMSSILIGQDKLILLNELESELQDWVDEMQLLF